VDGNHQTCECLAQRNVEIWLRVLGRLYVFAVSSNTDDGVPFAHRLHAAAHRFATGKEPVRKRLVDNHDAF
jgi:hypothetical protein